MEKDLFEGFDFRKFTKRLPKSQLIKQLKQAFLNINNVQLFLFNLYIKEDLKPLFETKLKENIPEKEQYDAIVEFMAQLPIYIQSNLAQYNSLLCKNVVAKKQKSEVFETYEQISYVRNVCIFIISKILAKSKVEEILKETENFDKLDGNNIMKYMVIETFKKDEEKKVEENLTEPEKSDIIDDNETINIPTKI